MFSVSPPVHVFSLSFAFCLHFLDDFLNHLRLFLCLNLLQNLIKSLHFLLGFQLAVRPEEPGRMSVGHVALVSLLRLEIHLAFLTFKQTNIVNLETSLVI